MLKTERDTKTMGERVLRAGRKFIKQRHPADSRGRLRKSTSVYFEHGQWWFYFETRDGEREAYSVVDAEGGPAIDGFDFEQI